MLLKLADMLQCSNRKGAALAIRLIAEDLFPAARRAVASP
jgi:hypothetical protein